jgi:hypothetical protein
MFGRNQLHLQKFPFDRLKRHHNTRIPILCIDSPRFPYVLNLKGRQKIPQERWSLSTGVQRITFQKIVMLIFRAVRTSVFTYGKIILGPYAVRAVRWLTFSSWFISAINEHEGQWCMQLVTTNCMKSDVFTFPSNNRLIIVGYWEL